MTIDDFIKKYTENLMKAVSGGYGGMAPHNMVQMFLDDLHDNKQALERGKPLRFKKVNQEIASNMTLTFYELEYGTEDEPNKVRFNLPSQCEQFAKEMKRPCEFVGEVPE